MNRRIFGAVLLVCGFFLSANAQMPTTVRFAGIVLAVVGLILAFIGSKKISIFKNKK